MTHGGQARYREDRFLGGFRGDGDKHIERIRNDRSVQDHAGDPGLRSLETDPADRRPGEGERGTVTRYRRHRGGPLAIRMVPIALQPTSAVGDGWIGLLAARPRRDHVERIDEDDG